MGINLACSGAVLGSATDQLAGWPHFHRVIGAAMLALTASGGAFLVAAWFRRRRLAAADAAGAGYAEKH